MRQHTLSVVPRPRSAGGPNAAYSPRSVPTVGGGASGSSPKSSKWRASIPLVALDAAISVTLGFYMIAVHVLAYLLTPSLWSGALVVASWAVTYFATWGAWGRP